MTEDEATILRLALACDEGGLPLRWRTVRDLLGERGWSVLDRLKKQGAMEHPGYDHWRITEKGRIAIALQTAADHRKA